MVVNVTLDWLGEAAFGSYVAIFSKKCNLSSVGLDEKSIGLVCDVLEQGSYETLK